MSSEIARKNISVRKQKLTSNNTTKKLKEKNIYNIDKLFSSSKIRVKVSSITRAVDSRCGWRLHLPPPLSTQIGSVENSSMNCACESVRTRVYDVKRFGWLLYDVIDHVIN